MTSTFILLRRFPQRVHLGERHRLEVASLRLCGGLDGAEAPRELGGGTLQRRFGIHLQMARQVGDGEEVLLKNNCKIKLGDEEFIFKLG